MLIIWESPTNEFVQNVLAVWSKLGSHEFYIIIEYEFVYFAISFTMSLVVLFSKRWHGAPFKALLVVSWLLVASWLLSQIIVLKMALLGATPVATIYMSAAIFLSARLFNSSQINPAYVSWIEPVKKIKFTKKI